MNHFATAFAQSPSPALLGVELFRATMELACHWPGLPAGARQGDGHPVVIFPGLGADGSSVATLREHCRSLGYDAFDWGRGFNTGPQGDLDTWLQALKSQVTDRLASHSQAATLIGWSLGGLYAREIGKLMAARVRPVITIGTPFNATTGPTRAGWLFQMLGSSSSRMDQALNLRLRTPPPMRTTSIYSRSDGIVAWQACRHDRPSQRVRDIEVEGSHMGLGWNRDVLAAVAHCLGQEARPSRTDTRAR